MHRKDIWGNSFNDGEFIASAKYFFANPVANQALEDGWGNLSARKVIVNNWSEFIAYAGDLPANNGEKEDSTAVTNAMKTFGLDKWRGWAKEGNIAYGLLGGTWESDSKAKYKQGIYIHTEDNKTVKISNGKVEEHNDCKSVLEGLKY
ncbi:MAG: hypothetical protein HUJ89_06230 [Bacteroidales bacterium]|nr:hypothetical protein [Bacteroidales bacterium]